MQLIHTIRDRIVALLNDDSGQDVFEYVLIVGGISAAIIIVGAVAVPGLFNTVVTGVCGAINAINFINVTCT